MDKYKERYEELKKEYEGYQKVVEDNMQQINTRNIKLEKDIDVLVNIVEISKYVNSYLSSRNLVSMINDMIVGLLGVSHSTILLEENGEFKIKATNIREGDLILNKEEWNCIKNKREFLFNSDKPLRSYEKYGVIVRSIMGIPIKIRSKFIGYIIVDSTIKNSLNEDQKVFLTSISNQIAISIENSMLYKELKDLTKRDPLIGIYNRKYFFQKISEYVEFNDNPYAVVMIDLDNFKKFNDTYGHQFGDEVLIQTSKLILNKLDKRAILARYGGEELAIFIKDIKGIEEIYEKVEDIRKSIEENIIEMDEDKASITASFGIGFYPIDGKDLTKVIKKADILLYRAKSSGKNKVIISDFII